MDDNKIYTSKNLHDELNAMRKKVKQTLLLILFVFLFCCGCEGQPGQAAVEEPVNESVEQYTLDVRFTATVESLIENKQAGDGSFRYAVVWEYRGTPFVVDLGAGFINTLEVGESYSFQMKEKTVDLITETYDLQSVISLYDLEVGATNVPEDNQAGVDSVEIYYTSIL